MTLPREELCPFDDFAGHGHFLSAARQRQGSFARLTRLHYADTRYDMVECRRVEVISHDIGRPSGFMRMISMPRIDKSHDATGRRAS